MKKALFVLTAVIAVAAAAVAVINFLYNKSVKELD